jgi:HD-GYP domain-containing protein (c-di-GMP phosphodiesterase class II)
MGWQVSRNLEPDLEANQQEIYLDKAKTLSTQIGRYVSGHFDRLESVATAISHLAPSLANAKQPLDEEAFIQLLDEYVGKEGLLQLTLRVPRDTGDLELSVHSPNFDPAAMAGELAPLTQEAEAKGARGSRSLSNPVVPAGQKVGSAIAVLAVPVKSANREVRGDGPVLVAVISMAPVQQIVEGIVGVGQGYTAFVLDDDRRPFAHADPEAIDRHEPMEVSGLVAERLEPSPVARTFQRSDAAGNTSEIIGAYHPIELDDHRWGVFVEVDKGLGLGQIEEMRTTTIRWGLLAFALAIVIGIAFSWRVTTPIHQLIESTRRIASGDYARRVKVGANNEMGMLADNFNVMTAEIGRTIEDLRVQKELNDQLFLSSIRSLAAAIDARDPYTRGHSERVTRYARTIARQLQLPPQAVRNVEIGALLHDVGKIGIEDRILRKPAALTPEEFEIMKAHPEKGGAIMEPIAHLRDATEIIIHHHERWDGQGYPSGLKGDEIPLGARIVNVADTFDAMTTNRPYQRAMTFSVAARKIGEFSGKACDPAVVRAFHAAFDAGLFGNVDPSERLESASRTG